MEISEWGSDYLAKGIYRNSYSKTFLNVLECTRMYLHSNYHIFAVVVYMTALRHFLIIIIFDSIPCDADIIFHG